MTNPAVANEAQSDRVRKENRSKFVLVCIS
jgi:hypothetical protein